MIRIVRCECGLHRHDTQGGALVGIHATLGPEPRYVFAMLYFLDLDISE